MCQLQRQRPTTVMIGAERDGSARATWWREPTHVAHIPIATDSLNAAMAAAIALYELTRSITPE